MTMWPTHVYDAPPSDAYVAVREPNFDARRSIEKALGQTRKRARPTGGRFLPAAAPAPVPAPAPLGECPVCWDTLEDDDAHAFNCGHHLCGECAQRWAEVESERSMASRRGVKVTCPLCRKTSRVQIET